MPVGVGCGEEVRVGGVRGREGGDGRGVRGLRRPMRDEGGSSSRVPVGWIGSNSEVASRPAWARITFGPAG